MTKTERIHTEYNQKLSLPLAFGTISSTPLIETISSTPLIDNDNLVVKTFYTSLGTTT
jgi:hypothetical protein